MDDQEVGSAAKLEELRVGAVSQGVEWLRRALSEISRDELPASRPGCCGWCGDTTTQPPVAHCSRAAQRVDGSLGAPQRRLGASKNWF